MCRYTYLSASAPNAVTLARVEEVELATWRAFLNAHAVLIQRIEQDLRAHGLPQLSWYDVLWPLYRAKERRLRMNELAEEVVLSRTGLVRLVDRVEAAGLLRREPVPEDGRGAYAVITDDGAATLRRMWPVYRRHIQHDFIDPLGAGAGRLRMALERIVEQSGRRGPPEYSAPGSAGFA
jgi:DNA-binding MarR family transcriptional regulator